MQLILFTICYCRTLAFRIIRKNFWLWKILARNSPTVFYEFGRLNAYLMCALAKRNVPAYRDFLEINGYRSKLFSLESFPETNKENYILKYGFAPRCQGGRIKVVGTMVDESAGSSGTPFNWVRSTEELTDIHDDFANYVRLEFPTDKLFTINAFSMGAWATGVNTGIAAAKVGMVKSTGPDIPKILDTIRAFGDEFDYLITGYPPFLKHLCDALDRESIPVGKFSLYGLVGGEGMTEALRSHVCKHFKKVVSGYGATDLEIGIAGEFAFTRWLRKQMIASPVLREKLLGPGETRLPMIFQFHPMDRFIEINLDSEVVVTSNNLSLMSPRLRYNIKDEGRIFMYQDIERLLKALGYDVRKLEKEFKDDFLKIPLLFLFGRKDGTVSFMGANIYPQDVEYGLYQNSEHAGKIERFCLSLEQKENADSSVVVNVELREGVVLEYDEAEKAVASFRSDILAHLEKVNRDFAQSLGESQSAADLKILLHAYRSGIFSTMENRIKNKYLVHQ